MSGRIEGALVEGSRSVTPATKIPSIGNVQHGDVMKVDDEDLTEAKASPATRRSLVGNAGSEATGRGRLAGQ